jgi:hypothetical protein
MTMKGKPILRIRRVWTAILFLAALGTSSAAQGQSENGKTSPASAPIVIGADEEVKPIPTTPATDSILQTGCSTCGGGLLGLGGGGDCLGCGCGGGDCIPGRKPCTCCCDSDTVVGRFINGLYQCVCCPDPCYDPHWLAVADAAFFQDAARPITQMRLRIDQMWDMNSPDRAEFFWARQRTALTGSGGRGPNPGNNLPVRGIDVSEIKLLTEAAAGAAGIAIEMPYRRIEGDFNSNGFADMTIATKALLLDCQLIQIAFQFKTYVPIGQASKGLGTGHVGLEPGLLWGLRLTSNTYLQAQTSLFIPVGGDQLYEGNIFHYHFSLNQILWHPCGDLQVVGTLEFNGWSILNGDQSDPVLGPVSADRNLASAGPGIRVVVCDKIDFGIGSAFAFTNQHWADEMIRIDFRWRF